MEHRDFEVFVATTADFCEEGIPSLKLKRAAWLQRLSDTRCVRLVRNFELLFYGTRLDRRVFDAAKEFCPDAVFTVADMTLCEQARKLAKRLGVPLVVNFQDWWPRGQFYHWHEKPYFWVRPILERRFRRLYRKADLAFCTSEGMREFLGPHPNAHVLYPIGANGCETSLPIADSGKRRAEKFLTTEDTESTEEGEEEKAESGNADPAGICAAFHGARKLKGEERGAGSRERVCAWTSQAGASESDSLASKLADAPVSESLISSADGPASSPATSHSQPDIVPEAALALDSGRSTLDSAVAKRRKRRLIYTGTAFGSYGKMLRELARELERKGHWELVIYGNTPDWPKEELEKAKQTGLYRGLLKFDELQRELHAADACLAVMSFEPELEVMMRTSFTTKMLDYCRVGKPVILWGPEYCSPLRLALEHNAAIVITSNEVVKISEKLEQLVTLSNLEKELGGAAMKLSQDKLGHSNIHNLLKLEFDKILMNSKLLKKSIKVSPNLKS